MAPWDLGLREGTGLGKGAVVVEFVVVIVIEFVVIVVEFVIVIFVLIIFFFCYC